MTNEGDEQPAAPAGARTSRPSELPWKYRLRVREPSPPAPTRKLFYMGQWMALPFGAIERVTVAGGLIHRLR